MCKSNLVLIVMSLCLSLVPAWAGGGGSGVQQIHVRVGSSCRGKKVNFRIQSSSSSIDFEVVGRIGDQNLNENAFIYWNADTYSKTIEAKGSDGNMTNRPLWMLLEYNEWTDGKENPGLVGHFKALRIDSKTNKYVEIDHDVNCDGL